MAAFRILEGDCIEQMRELPDESVQCCVTSPPYWGLRDYGAEGQLGLEPTPEQYVANMVAVFREVRRVLRDDGTLWLNLGDSYAGAGKGPSNDRPRPHAAMSNVAAAPSRWQSIPDGIKPKDLVGIPWMVAFALRADGWYLRSDIIWAKPNPMPESVTDRPTKAHEYLFLLSKSPRYYYDAEAIKEPAEYAGPNSRQLSPYAQGFARRTQEEENARQDKQRQTAAAAARAGGSSGRRMAGFNERWDEREANGDNPLGRNKRSVWTVATQPFPDAHFATFPPKLIEPCILAGSAEGDTVLDPFAGAGTTGLVALRHNRDFIGIELNPEYAEMARRRIHDDAPLLNAEAA